MGGEPLELRRRRLRLLACRRGFLEVELALRPFVEAELSQMDHPLLDQLERLLEMEDLDLWEVLCGRRPLPSEVGPELLRRLRRYLPRAGGGEQSV